MNEEFEEFSGHIIATVSDNRNCEQFIIGEFADKCQKEKMEFDTDEDILTAFDEWKEDEELAFEKLQDINYYSCL